jgi:hypothetical protein
MDANLLAKAEQLAGEIAGPVKNLVSPAGTV